jgi:uncharacterized membrane protein YcaP (DUF421 family)
MVLAVFFDAAPNWLWPGGHSLFEIAGRTVIVYLVILIGLRLSGKREVGQMTPFDLTLLLLLSNSVQNAMTGPDTSLLGGILAAGVLLVMNFGFAEASGLNRRFRKLIQGQPTLLVYHGKVIESHLAKEHISMEEVSRAMREHGVASVHDMSLCILEVDGSISCLTSDDVPHDLAPQRRLKVLQKKQ